MRNDNIFNPNEKKYSLNDIAEVLFKYFESEYSEEQSKTMAEFVLANFFENGQELKITRTVTFNVEQK